MKQFLVTEQQRIDILKKHQSLNKNKKNLIREQSSEGLTKLRNAKKEGCFPPGGQIFQAGAEYYYAVPNQNPNWERRYYADGTMQFHSPQSTVGPSKIQKPREKNPSPCKALGPKLAPGQNVENQIAGLKQRNFFSYDELIAQGVNHYDIMDKGQYEQYPQALNGEFYFKKKIEPNSGTTTYSVDQQPWVRFFQSKNYKMPEDIPAPERLDYIAVDVESLGAPKGLFKAGFQVFKEKGDVSKKEDIEAEITTPDRQACKARIDNFYRGWKSRTSFLMGKSPDELMRIQREAQICTDAYYGNWGILQGGKDLDAKIKELSTQPPSRGTGSNFRLVLTK